MTKNPKQIKQLYVKCDNPECDWIGNNILLKDLYAGYPCPLCKNIIINEQDMKVVRYTKVLVKVDNIIRKLTFWRKPVETDVRVNTERVNGHTQTEIIVGNETNESYKA